MALKHFHILFVTLALVFCAYTAKLCWASCGQGGGDVFKYSAWICAAACPLLLAYGIGFYNKIKNIRL